MTLKLTAPAALLLATVIGGAAEARPYLMLAADDKGFRAADMGDIQQEGLDTAQITLISAPLAGAPYGGKLAAIMKQRVEFECQGTRWRVTALGYADAKDQPLASDPVSEGWRPVGEDALLATARDAACLRRFRQAMISRDLNLGDIVTNFHKAWSAPAPEPLSDRQKLKQHFDANH